MNFDPVMDGLLKRIGAFESKLSEHFLCSSMTECADGFVATSVMPKPIPFPEYTNKVRVEKRLILANTSERIMELINKHFAPKFYIMPNVTGDYVVFTMTHEKTPSAFLCAVRDLLHDLEPKKELGVDDENK